MQGVNMSKVGNVKTKEMPSRKKKDQPNEQSYYTMNVRQVPAPSETAFRDRVSSYKNIGIKSATQTQQSTGTRDESCVVDNGNGISIGQMLCHLLEKSLNIQYLDFR